jgi:hypothetical protein
MPKLIRCPKGDDAEMVPMPHSYVLQRGEFVDGDIPLVIIEPLSRALLRIYICGMCGYYEFYFPSLIQAHLIEGPPGIERN